METFGPCVSVFYWVPKTYDIESSLSLWIDTQMIPVFKSCVYHNL